MKKILLLTAFCLLLTVNAGCAPSAPAPQKTNTSTAQIVIKKPPSEISQNPAADFCEKNNNELIIRFDQTAQKSQSYCRFPDTTECAVEAYMSGTCGPGNGSKIYQPEKISALTASETCSNESQPVCATGNITFSNPCVAKMQNANIMHTGPCVIVSAPKTIEKQPPASLDTSPAGQPDWLSVAASFILSKPKSNPQAHLDRCSQNGQTVYLLSGGCADCVDTLYDANGKTLCYPSNDFSGACAGFSASTATCESVWTDKR